MESVVALTRPFGLLLRSNVPPHSSVQLLRSGLRSPTMSPYRGWVLSCLTSSTVPRDKMFSRVSLRRSIGSSVSLPSFLGPDLRCPGTGRPCMCMRGRSPYFIPSLSLSVGTRVPRRLYPSPRWVSVGDCRRLRSGWGRCFDFIRLVRKEVFEGLLPLLDMHHWFWYLYDFFPPFRSPRQGRGWSDDTPSSNP